MLIRGAYELGVGNTKKALVKRGFDPKNLVLGADGVIHDSRLGTPLFFFAFLFFLLFRFLDLVFFIPS
jgi:hypothetical protein